MQMPQWVQAHTGGAVEVRRFPIAVGVSNTVEVHLDYHADAFMTAPIAVGVSNTVEVHLDYHADAFMTAENVHEYCITVVLPQFLDEARKLIAEHNNDPKAHPHILAGIEDLNARVSLIELQYGTDVNGNPFIVTFETLDGVNVQGVWNEPGRRIEF